MFPRYRHITPLIRKVKSGQAKNITVETEECSSAESDDLEDIYKRKPNFEHYSYPDDYWKFKKSVKYLSYGRPIISALALITAYDCDFQDPIMLKALQEHRILETLLNFLKSDEKRIQAISLKFLKKLAKIRVLRHKIVYLRGIEALVLLLEEPQIDLKQEAAAVITAIADFHKAWQAVRVSGGIPLLVNMIYLPNRLLQDQPESMSQQQKDVLKAAENAAEALFTICKCRRNQMEFLNSGALRGCKNILKTPHVRLCTLVLQIIIRCSHQKIVRLVVKNLRMIENFRIHFYSEDQSLMQAAARAAFSCAEGDESRAFFGKAGFVDKLFEIMQTSAFHSNYELMASISCALWRCSENESNLKRIQALNAGPLMIQLLNSQPKHVQEYLTACLGCCLTNPQIRTVIRKNNGIETLIGLLHTTHPPLIMHLNKALAIASDDNDCLQIMEKHDALRLIWSHLKNENPSVVSNTAWQLAAIMKNFINSAAYVRSLVGGVQVLMERLRGEHNRVSTPICALIVVLSQDPENVRILTDYKVVHCLSELTNTTCRRLRYHLCMAITAVCPYKNNRKEFTRRRVVLPLIRILKSKTPEVAGAATHALYQLAHIPVCCAVMYNSSGVYEILMKQLKSENRDVQECAAGIIQKMRLFPLNRDGNIPTWLIEKHSDHFS
ncbi:outer dynein arm-docking complex subunit 2-like [Parasteatoda tepidariorum]|uniref:outer dynein arm-docking complex subunit 2-like n=1 Tax=Parasteatoda tepidariorum TaxID=114398 RepID=UPI00077FB45C|nr:outer dynein arm-docking complex subunit 2-like [Parasteatoda tepidariorum]